MPSLPHTSKLLCGNGQCAKWPQADGLPLRKMQMDGAFAPSEKCSFIPSRPPSFTHRHAAPSSAPCSACISLCLIPTVLKAHASIESCFHNQLGSMTLGSSPDSSTRPAPVLNTSRCLSCDAATTNTPLVGHRSAAGTGPGAVHYLVAAAYPLSAGRDVVGAGGAALQRRPCLPSRTGTQ